MPQTITKTDNRQIIAGVFTDHIDADNATAQLGQIGYSGEDVQRIVLLDDKQAEHAYRTALVGRGVAESQAFFYARAVREGKILLAVHNVTEPGPVVDILDENGATYNPDGSRNLREDVAGMTVGAAAGSVAGAVAGAMAGGPIGIAVGAAAGAVIGGGVGAVAGKASEHNK